MADRLPLLSALRAFAAAARNLSFTKAGLEPNVTRAAVRYQVQPFDITRLSTRDLSDIPKLLVCCG